MSYQDDFYATLRARFGERQVLTDAEVIERFWPDVDPADVAALFEVLTEEYRLPAGILRPDDPVSHLTTPIPTRNPLRWFVYQPPLEDKQSELEMQLGKRMKRHGLTRRRIVTFDDLVRAWCGKP